MARSGHSCSLPFRHDRRTGKQTPHDILSACPPRRRTEDDVADADDTEAVDDAAAAAAAAADADTDVDDAAEHVRSGGAASIWKSLEGKLSGCFWSGRFCVIR